MISDLIVQSEAETSKGFWSKIVAKRRNLYMLIKRLNNVVVGIKKTPGAKSKVVHVIRLALHRVVGT